MKMRYMLCFVLLATLISRVNVNAHRRKELQVIKEIKFNSYNAEQRKIFNAIVELVGQTTEDTTGNWLHHGDSCDPDFHRDGLSSSHDLSRLYNSSITKQLCSIFEDMACDTVEKVCKCWTAGGIGRMEWQPEIENPRKPKGRCVMTARQRCGSLEMPPGLYPHVNFPLLRNLPCDLAGDFKCRADVDGISRCTNKPDRPETSAGHLTRFAFHNIQLYIPTISFYIMGSYY